MTKIVIDLCILCTFWWPERVHGCPLYLANTFIVLYEVSAFQRTSSRVKILFFAENIKISVKILLISLKKAFFPKKLNLVEYSTRPEYSTWQEKKNWATKLLKMSQKQFGVHWTISFENIDMGYPPRKPQIFGGGSTLKRQLTLIRLSMAYSNSAEITCKKLYFSEHDEVFCGAWKKFVETPEH